MKNNKNLDTLTVGELKELLDNFDDEMPVLFCYNYGDYWSTVVAETIGADDVDEGKIFWSSYHNKYKVVLNDDYSELTEEDGVDVLIIGRQ